MNLKSTLHDCAFENKDNSNKAGILKGQKNV